MAEGFSVASRLTFTTNATTVVAELFRSFERLNTVVSNTQGNLNRLAAELRTLNRGGQGLSRSVTAIEKLSQIRLSPELVSGMANVARSATEAAAAARALGRTSSPAAPRSPGGGNQGGGSAPRAFGHHDLLNASMGATMIGDEGMGFFGGALKAEMEVREQLAMLRMNTKVDEAGIERARAVAERITKLTPGTTIAENLHHVVEAFTLMGDMTEAMEGAPAFAQASYLFKNMPGAHKGDTSFAAAQATELMQRQIVNGHVDMEAFNKQMAAMVQVAYGTGGRVDGNAYLGFAKQSRVGGMVANDQYLNRDLPALLIALGGSRAGTGDSAVWNQFVTGKMTESAFSELQKAGLVDKSAKWEGGRVADMENHLRGAAGFGANRVQWVRDEFYGKDGVFARNGIDPNDKLGVSRFLSKWNSRQTGLGFMSETALGMPTIDKEAAKIGDTTGKPLDVMRKYDPSQAVREFKAAENDLMVALGKEALGPAIEALKGLTEVVKQLGEVAKAHPDLAKDIVLVGGGLSILAKGAGEAALVVYLGAPLIGGIRALAAATTLFAAGTPAGLALLALGAGIATLAAAFSTIPKIGSPDAKSLLDELKARPKGGSPEAWTPHGEKQGYLMQSPHQQSPIQLTSILHVDGKEMARSTERYMVARMAGPPSGAMSADRTINPYAGSLST